ncbi:hypothetical protein AALO_G00261730 [Alosa alosa]|uniref:RRM domain-containing protein n=1 Tax=Alosa alosa TaxID=278164 RepID=A0AAV6FQJ3_9TELE|nr:hypothetical protein AALO_G00261730 [Alosa alosa]
MNVSVDSRSPSKSERGSPANAKSDSRSGSASPSRASKRSESRSRSRSKSRSHSRRHSNRRYSRSRSHSRKKSRSRSYSPEYRRRKSQSTSPMSNRRRHAGSRGSHGHGKQDKANPDPNTCLGVFGLSLYTTERDLREVFSRHGPLAGVNASRPSAADRAVAAFVFAYWRDRRRQRGTDSPTSARAHGLSITHQKGLCASGELNVHARVLSPIDRLCTLPSI